MLSTGLYDERFNLALANFRSATTHGDQDRATHETSTLSHLIVFMSDHGFIVDHAEGPHTLFHFIRNGYTPATAFIQVYSDLTSSTFQAEFEYFCYLNAQRDIKPGRVELQARKAAKYATSPEERAYLASVLTYFGLSSAWMEK